jgi:polyhydroxyalkanoate synthase
MFCWYLRNTYLENKLRVPGATTQCSVAVDLGKVKVPAFLYASREDHISPGRHFPVRNCRGATPVLGAGHIAGVNPLPQKAQPLGRRRTGMPRPAGAPATRQAAGGRPEGWLKDMRTRGAAPKIQATASCRDQPPRGAT